MAEGTWPRCAQNLGAASLQRDSGEPNENSQQSHTFHELDGMRECNT